MINTILLIIILINVIDKKKIKLNIKSLIKFYNEYKKKEIITKEKITKEEYEKQKKALEKWENGGLEIDRIRTTTTN